MSKEEAIEILKNMNDGFTFRDCSVCIEDNKYDEKDGICKSKTCEYLKSIETVLGYVRELEEERELRIHYENRLDNMEQLYVDKDKIRDKIEELEKEKLKYDNEIRIYTMRESFDFQEMILNELLEEE